MPCRLATLLCVFSAILTLGCQEQPVTNPVQLLRENVTLQSHVAPDCYRFDDRLNEARVIAGPAADDSTFYARFDFGAGGLPWAVAEGKARTAVADGVLTIETETAAHCDSPGMSGVVASGVSAILLETRMTGCSKFTLAWRGENAEFLPENEIAVDSIQQESWQSFVIDTGPYRGWTSHLGNAGQLRLIVPEKAKVELRSIGLAKRLDLFAGKSSGVTDYEFKKRQYVHALFARTPCALEYDVTVMPDARLVSGFLHPDRVPARFRILLKDGATQTVLAEEQEEHANVDRPVAVDLSAWTNKKVQIRFEAETDQPGKVVLWSNPSVSRVFPVTAERRPINVIWYVIDCLRATNVSAYGYPRETTYAIDAVAKEGVRFEWCFSPGCWTIDSVASFFTGLSPNAHGLARTRQRIPASMHVLPEILRRAGYTTALISQNPYVDKGRGFVRGFDEARRLRVREPGSKKGVSAENYPTNVAIADFLKDHREDPVFLYVHMIEPHGPYIPPVSLRVFAQPDGTTKQTDLYDDCIVWADGNLEHMIGELKAEGLWNNTLLIVTADHGQCFSEWDNGIDGHGLEPYLSRVRTPLIMRLPGIIPAGLTVKENVQSLDIPSTLFDLLQIPPDPQFGGMSLLGLLDGTRKDEFAQRSIYPSGQLPKWQAVVKDRWFFVDNDGKGQLIDLWTNPSQSANEIQANPGIAQELLEAARKFRESEMAKAGQFPANPAGTVQIDSSDRKELEALGYVK